MKSAKALPRYGSGRTDGKTDGRKDRRTERQTDGKTDEQRQNNFPPPMAGGNYSLTHTRKITTRSRQLQRYLIYMHVYLFV